MECVNAPRVHQTDSMQLDATQRHSTPLSAEWGRSSEAGSRRVASRHAALRRVASRHAVLRRVASRHAALRQACMNVYMENWLFDFRRVGLRRVTLCISVCALKHLV